MGNLAVPPCFGKGTTFTALSRVQNYFDTPRYDNGARPSQTT